MSRKALFDAVRPFAPGGKLMPLHVEAIDELADMFALPREGEAMKVSRAGIDLIHSFEGFRSEAYVDPGTGGLPITIGFGSTTDEEGRPIKLGTVWSRERAAARFQMDLDRFAAGVLDALDGSPTTQGQFDAMVSLAYNVGLANFRGSTLLKMHKAGDYAGARQQFGRWNRAGGRVMAGLTRRRAAEAALYAS
ncbi:lysozyme [Brevundimonas viscosa]|uniref:Lysozyme n=1 Tax=Brevundimonas viscosa TaxID=871741 RepID=A0A1I6PPK5_9CAUL|nr:lysozyme [Brevundimonas viscosa]SFS42050.1 Phage-related lysozyme (muramidase), GH24 family [Brevundimonas viscosa]